LIPATGDIKGKGTAKGRDKKKRQSTKTKGQKKKRGRIIRLGKKRRVLLGDFRFKGKGKKRRRPTGQTGGEEKEKGSKINGKRKKEGKKGKMKRRKTQLICWDESRGEKRKTKKMTGLNSTRRDADRKNRGGRIKKVGV